MSYFFAINTIKYLLTGGYLQMQELTKTEEVIMLTIWKMEKDISLSSITEAVKYEPRAKTWKPQTISTYFRKLAEKKYIKMIRNGKDYTYKPLITKEKYCELQLNNLFHYYFDGDKETLINSVNNL